MGGILISFSSRRRLSNAFFRFKAYSNGRRYLTSDFNFRSETKISLGDIVLFSFLEVILKVFKKSFDKKKKKMKIYVFT